ncbi:glycosyltransferase family 4 protein [Aestuariivivens sp. NBU2969]|uniref:glycosyltransferase family 4 protein n=1 Tax=Aestuariivivens sp. NBU2969 TaxID=2873267 RepID=UPI001CBB70BC|nr:glycosyltransferase family 4 protein [Aestuariivivens sp. NBU2969]
MKSFFNRVNNGFKKLLLLLQLLLFFGLQKKKVKKAKILFFFPFYHTGGAERIHLQIVQSVLDVTSFVFFTKISNDSKFYKCFKETTNVGQIHKFIRHNGLVKALFLKYLIKNINSAAVVFGCNTEFYYELLPLLSNNIKKIDLIHAFSFPDYGIEQFSLPYISYLGKRIVINSRSKEDLIHLYKENNIDDIYIKNIVTIENAIKSTFNSKKERFNTFNVGYVGRWAKEKRPELFIKVANAFCTKKLEAQFLMTGFDPLDISNKDEFNISYKGILNDKSMVCFYNDIDVLLITSYREGMPLAVIEAMLMGVVVISTNIGSIFEHVKNDETGYIIENFSNEKYIVRDMIGALNKLYQDRALLERLSLNSQRYAKATFNINTFNQAYKDILLKNV